MKQFAKLFYLFFILVFTTYCEANKEERNSQFLAPLTIQIPYELIDNKETIDFFKWAESSINKYSDNIETMVFNGRDIVLQDPNIMSESDKNKFSLMTVRFVSNTTQMTGVLDETQEYIENAKINGFDESQLRSLEIIEITLENRIFDIKDKYKKYFK